MDVDMSVPALARDWAGGFPEPALVDLALQHLDPQSLKAASLVCKRWNAVLTLPRKVVHLLPASPSCQLHPNLPSASSSTATAAAVAIERFPPHLFSHQLTVCLLPLSEARLTAANSLAELAVYGTALATHRLPTLAVTYTLDESSATCIRQDGVRRAQEAARAGHQAAAAAAPAPWAAAGAAAGAARRPSSRQPPHPHPQQPYYDLSAPLTQALLALLGAASGPRSHWQPDPYNAPAAAAPPPPGQWLRCLELRLAALPAPQALAPLALLPSLRDLRLLGGRSAFLEAGHLAALEPLTRLTALSLQGVWDMTRPAGVGLRVPDAALAGWGVVAAGDIPAGAQLAILPGAPGMPGMAIAAPAPGGAPGPAAAAPGPAAAAPDAMAVDEGPEPPEAMPELLTSDDDDDEPDGGLDNTLLGPGATWPPLFAALESLQTLRLASLNDASRLGFQRSRSPLHLDLHSLPRLRDLAVSGWQLEPGLRSLERESVFQRLTRLETDRVLTLREWEALRGLEELAEVELRAEVAGYVDHRVIGGSVVVKYGRSFGGGVGGDGDGSSFGAIQFPLPPLQSAYTAASAAAGGSGGSSGEAADDIAAALAGGGGAADGSVGGEAWRRRRERIQALAELHVRLEPLRFLSDNTTLQRLSLRWPRLPPPLPPPHHQHQHHHHLPAQDGAGGAVPLPPPPPPLAPGPAPAPALPRRRFSADDAVLARRNYVPFLTALSELQDVELWCPGGEVVLDGPLLEALAPCWRRLGRLVFHGVVRQSALAALTHFRGLKELGLHDVASQPPAPTPPAAPPPSPQRGDDTHRGAHKLLLATASLPPSLERLALRGANVLHVPGAGTPRLQRLELGHDCRWQAGRATAAAGSPARPGVPSPPASAGAANASPGGAAVAGGTGAGTGAGGGSNTGPWRLLGLPLLTHLRLQAAPVSAAELRVVLGSCGRQLRSLALGLLLDQAQAASLLAALSDSAHQLPNLVHLELHLRPDAADPWFISHTLAEYTSARRQPSEPHHFGGGGGGLVDVFQDADELLQLLDGAGGGAAAAEAGPGGGLAGPGGVMAGLDPWILEAAAVGGPGIGGGAGGGDGGILWRLGQYQAALEALLPAVREAVKAVLLLAAPPPARSGPGRLPRLRELWLELPAVARGRAMPAAAAQQQQQGGAAALQSRRVEVQRQMGAVVDALAELGKMEGLEQLRLAGPALSRLAQRLERRLLAALPHCHLDIAHSPVADRS